MYARSGQTIIIKDTHRALWYEDGKLVRVLEAGRHKAPHHLLARLRNPLRRPPQVEIVLVDVRERDLTIKGQEILTADKVAIRVSILVQFRVTDPKSAIHTVENYQDRLYSDVQLAARRSLASMMLEEILTNRNRLSEEILADVKEAATGYGVAIRRADVKDLIFPGNLQEIMNRVLAAERNSQAQLVEARTRAEVDEIQAKSQAEAKRRNTEAEIEATRLRQEAEAEAARLRAETEARVYAEREKAAEILQQHPALLRLAELETLRDLAANANARIYLGLERTGLSIGGADDRREGSGD
jgi:regulator of protease activity HflC (stomatin/prohibitin superfamily)